MMVKPTVNELLEKAENRYALVLQHQKELGNYQWEQNH